MVASRAVESEGHAEGHVDEDLDTQLEQCHGAEREAES